MYFDSTAWDFIIETCMYWFIQWRMKYYNLFIFYPTYTIWGSTSCMLDAKLKDVTQWYLLLNTLLKSYDNTNDNDNDDDNVIFDITVNVEGTANCMVTSFFIALAHVMTSLSKIWIPTSFCAVHPDVSMRTICKL